MQQTGQTNSIRGYIEGYYGKLLSWQERTELLESLSFLGLNTYCYAPKEDPQHRFKWREPHPAEWNEGFRGLSKLAKDFRVSIVAGIAPGLDFNKTAKTTESDFKYLQKKAQTYLTLGATEILILWDDIDDDFISLDSISEGTTHARTVNRLSEALGRPLWTVPRVYAAEIENKNNYLEDFFIELQPEHTVLLCGKAIVSSNVQQADLAELSRAASVTSTALPGSTDAPKNLKHRTIVWDNFYANDYCPRRLFVGPWSGRENITEFLINPTGMPYTDRLLLDIAISTHTASDSYQAWLAALKRHSVPESFIQLAPYFSAPCFGDRVGDVKSSHIQATHETEQAIEDCLWQWKSPLAREWYPFIFGLKHDLALMQGNLPEDRILKTQTSCLSQHLLK